MRKDYKLQIINAKLLNCHCELPKVVWRQSHQKIEIALSSASNDTRFRKCLQKIFCLFVICNLALSIVFAGSIKPQTSWIIFRKLQSAKPKPLTIVAGIRGDLSSVIYNPSGLATLNRQELFILTELRLAEDKFAGAIYGYPLRSEFGCGIAVGAVLYDAGQTTMYFIDRAGSEKSMTFSVRNDLLGLISYARGISEKFQTGFSVKFASTKFVEEISATAVAIDLGGRYQQNNLALSFAVQNLGLSTRFISTKEKLPTAVSLGAGYFYNFPKNKNTYLTVAADIPYILAESRVTPSIGVEFTKLPVSVFFGYRLYVVDRVLSFGFGLNMKNFDLSYSFTPAKWLSPTHRLSFGIRFW